jgi:hypothetical protein
MSTLKAKQYALAEAAYQVVDGALPYCKYREMEKALEAEAQKQ